MRQTPSHRPSGCSTITLFMGQVILLAYRIRRILKIFNSDPHTKDTGESKLSYLSCEVSGTLRDIHSSRVGGTHLKQKFRSLLKLQGALATHG